MAIYYVGPGGNNSNNGTTWALRKLTLNGAEDIPVAAADTVYVGPGVYRELLTCDVSGTAGNIITYIGDVTGQNTDGVGGTVRITGSDNDTTATRAICINVGARDYRTFRGFTLDLSTGENANIAMSGSNCIVEECNFSGNNVGVQISGTGTANTVRRCIFRDMNRSIYFTHTSTVSDAGHAIENCMFLGGGRIISIERVGGISIKHCFFMGGHTNAVRITTALAAGQTVTVTNCIITACGIGLGATTTGEIIENYNSISQCSTARINTDTGANSNTFYPLWQSRLIAPGIKFPNVFYSLSESSPLRAITGTGMAADDLFGVTRPVTDSKKSWGPIQHQPISRDTATKRTGAASIKLADAARHQMFVPTDGTEITVSVYAYWEANYAGDKPQLIVKQPGQSDSTDTATGAAANWEELSITLTPAASPPYVVVELVSRNTATSGSYGTYFDDLTVT